MSSPIWASPFGISDSDIADLKSQLDGQDDPLRWILANGYIPSADYIRWAMDQYELPSLRENFFEIPADPVYWEAVKHLFAWTPGFFPLADWEGVMLIGCVEPPQFHFPIHTPHRFVIASAAALERRFRELEPVSSGADHTVASATAEHASTQPAQSLQETVAETVRQRPPDEVLADQLPQAPDVDMHDPEGLVVDFHVPEDPKLFAVPEGMHVDDLGKPVPTTPDGFEFNSELIDMDTLDFSDASAAPKTQTVRQTPQSAPANAPAPSAAAQAPTARAPIVPPGPPPAAAAKTGPTPPPIPMPSKSNVSMAEPVVPLATCTTIDALTSAAIAQINLHFEHAVLLMYEKSVLRPYKWSELLLSVKGDNPDPVSLEQPSIFRIAARTSLPYHGYVVANPTNTAFFNAFTRGVLPKHVTVMPVVVAGQVTAMLMGISMSDVDYKASLAAMEKLASDFSTQFERLHTRGKAAA